MYKISEAAKATGVSKATLHRARASGKISASKDERGHFIFDPSELHRVFPRRSETPHEVINDAQRGGNDTLTNTVESEVSKAKLDAAERIITKHEETIADLRDRLDAEGEERRKLTAMLTDQRPKGLWARITGR